MLKKDAFLWNDSIEEAFQQLEKVITTPHVLSLPDFTKGFEIECDASGAGIGRILMQCGKPIAFLHKVFKGKNLRTYEKNLFTLVVAIKKWRQYLQHFFP